MYENIQMATLITWRYDFEKGALAIQSTNFAVIYDNYFPGNFGIQFIVFLIIMAFFLFIVVLTDKWMHSPTATLIRRKKIIFPVRITTLTFNILFLTSLIQVATINESTSIKLFPFVLAVFGMVCVLLMLVGVGVVSNWKKFQVDDPNYYVLV